MSVMCLVFDKERKYYSLLADIFDITGHKLLVAFSEDKAKELLKVSNPSIIILTKQDINFWLELLKEGLYIYPFVFVRDYEEGESLKGYGLGEENFIVLPFNPLELLSKVLGLSKNPSTGFNAILKLIRDNLSAVARYNYQEGVCEIYISKGIVKGSTCSPDVIRRIIAEGRAPELSPYYDMGSHVKYLFKNNAEFISLLFERELITQKEVEEPTTPEVIEVASYTDLSQPMELGVNFYWVGHARKDSLFHRNSYLCIYEKDDIKVPILINPGSVEDYPHVRAKIEQIVGTIDALKAVVLFGSFADELYSIVRFLQANKRLFILTSIPIALQLSFMGVPMNRIRVFESLPNHTLRLATGDTLRFIPVNGFKDHFFVFDEGNLRVFTGRLFSSLSLYEEFNPIGQAEIENVEIYLKSNHLCKEYAEALIKNLSPHTECIFPSLGNPVRDIEGVKALLRKIFEKPQETVDNSKLIQACEEVISELEASYDEKAKEVLMELSQYVYIEDGKVADTLIEASYLPKLILSLMLTKGVKATLIKEALRKFYKIGVAVPTI